jgi:hypothetical protein
MGALAGIMGMLINYNGQSARLQQASADRRMVQSVLD